MELKKGLPITSFTKGDIIIKVEANCETIVTNGKVVQMLDNSFRKEPMRFLGIAYNLIYLENIGGYFDGRTTTALLEEFHDG